MFGSVLVANRGEIALRIFRTLTRMGVRSVAAYSGADAGARHVREADLSVRLESGGAGGAAAYLDVAAVVDAARRAGADAVHPGYGFLSEKAALAEAVTAAGLAWIGPPASAIEAMGDKIRAKDTVAAWGVPTVPGGGRQGMSDQELADVAESIGFPVLIKPSAGGGGKGMHVVTHPGHLPRALATARREAAAAFGDDTLLIERWVENPRHIEIQVLADGHGHAIHLGERECSLQRRHQKVVEEAPSPLVAGHPGLRSKMGAAAVDAARAVGYSGAGTVEFVVPGSQPGEFFFMEMNTRLQVEHPVTEMITGIDLVEWQVRVAAGEHLGIGQEDVSWSGHAVEGRVYAEDPARGFVPTGGRVLAWRTPGGEGIRVDDGVSTGDVVTSDFDPMLAKVVAWGASRADALRGLDGALAATTLLGVTGNVSFLRRLVTHPPVAAGDLDTGLIERDMAELGGAGDERTIGTAAMAAALVRWCQLWAAADRRDPWSTPAGWRVGGAGWLRWRLRPAGGEPLQVSIRQAGRVGDEVEVEVAAAFPPEGGEGTARRATCRAELDGDEVTVWCDGARHRLAWAEGDGRLWLGEGGATWSFEDLSSSDAGESAGSAGGAGAVRSPMPGVVRVLRVAEGDTVEAGQEILAVEAMKMEYSVTAGVEGRVRAVRVREGQRVALDEVLAEIEAADGG